MVKVLGLGNSCPNRWTVRARPHITLKEISLIRCDATKRSGCGKCRASIQLNRNNITQSVPEIERSFAGLRHDRDRLEVEERSVGSRVELRAVYPDNGNRNVSTPFEIWMPQYRHSPAFELWCLLLEKEGLGGACRCDVWQEVQPFSS